MKKSSVATSPKGTLIIRTIAMPEHTNPNGDIFGGWLVSQMDLAGMGIASQVAKGRVATVAIDSMSFLKPVHVGDFICCYGVVNKVGRTSVTVTIEAWKTSFQQSDRVQVTQGVFTFVAIDSEGKSRPMDTPHKDIL